MTETRVVEHLGGYQTTVYPTALGEFWRISTRDGPAIKALSPHSEPWSVILTAKEARDAAAALMEIADDIEKQPDGR